ncbi:type II toxin-antitoxin system HicB family antitoxin [Okeania sp.]|uniref:type II toxin-antitoxin system HicB family antitoxin n=1 Tax=Okeania sp. TaxID=3100323 RepID=UPI002B4B4283|nr:type II toxin-antitoxin system HicB family antitoxin [Okeania sp.]MEB3339453.1 type II toxin-antitoxin system HicB family antitoxin [Okeania sp.]
MKEYIVIFEWTGNNYSAYVPDLLGCISTGKTLEETENNIREAMELYQDLRSDPKYSPKNYCAIVFQLYIYIYSTFA